jgi:hypothetical protein
MMDTGMDVIGEVFQMRQQGLTDDVIMGELQKQGVPPDAATAALTQSGGDAGMPVMDYPSSIGGMPPQQPMMDMQSQMPPPDMMSERTEEIVENLINQKWTELVREVQKIIDWKARMEERQMHAESDLTKLREDYKTLHEAVLGKLQQYDDRMENVSTELNAVGKVFQDTVPQFIENVKDFSHMMGKHKKKKE